MNKSYYVYILTNHKNTVFYTGVTSDLERRTFEHKNKVNPNSFSAKYKLYKLVWFEEFHNSLDAITAEKIIKDWRREKKLRLIKINNQNLSNLFTAEA